MGYSLYLKVQTAIPTIFSLPEDNQVLRQGSRGEGANTDYGGRWVAGNQEEEESEK